MWHFRKIKRMLRKRYLGDDVVREPARRGEQQGRKGPRRSPGGRSSQVYVLPSGVTTLPDTLLQTPQALDPCWIETFKQIWKHKAIAWGPFLLTNSFIWDRQVRSGNPTHILFLSYYFIQVSGKWTSKCAETRVKMCKHCKCNVVNIRTDIIINVKRGTSSFKPNDAVFPGEGKEENWSSHTQCWK